jgi:hypothetical protein
VRVHQDDRVRLETVEDLRAETPEPRDEADLLALVDLQPDLLGQHDRGDVRDDPRADDLSHRVLLSDAQVQGAVQTFFTSE